MLTKQAILAACNLLLDERSTRLNTAIAASREAANNDTKSSAGDKYETTREMMQAEMDRLGNQLAEVSKLKEALFQAESAKQTVSISIGSIVKTTRGIYFLAAGLGKVSVDGQDVFVISTASPIGQLLCGKCIGDEIVFNGIAQSILEVG